MTSLIQARQLLQQGDIAAADEVYAQVLVHSPENIEALNAVALGALRRGEPARAVEHLQKVIRLQPQLHVSRLYLGIALERAGEKERALIQFARALQDAQAKGRWLNAQTTPANLRQLVEHAVITVRTKRREIFFRLLEPMTARYGRSELTRVERCLRIYLNEEPANWPDERQRPTFLYFPDLPTTPYIDRDQLDWIEGLEAQTDAIRAELESLLPSSKGRERVFTSDELERANLRGLDVPPSWNGYYFYRHGVRREDNCATCPVTARALEALPLAHVRDHGPEVLYSVFTPGTHLLPHRGVTNTRLVGHLPLMVPENCALRVGGIEHVWQEGRVVVFDDTYEHEAWNRSKRTRVVMIFDIWNPYLTEAERHAVAELVAGIGDFRTAVEAA